MGATGGGRRALRWQRTVTHQTRLFGVCHTPGPVHAGPAPRATTLDGKETTQGLLAELRSALDELQGAAFDLLDIVHGNEKGG